MASPQPIRSLGTGAERAAVATELLTPSEKGVGDGGTKSKSHRHEEGSKQTGLNVTESQAQGP